MKLGTAVRVGPEIILIALIRFLLEKSADEIYTFRSGKIPYGML